MSTNGVLALLVLAVGMVLGAMYTPKVLSICRALDVGRDVLAARGGSLVLFVSTSAIFGEFGMPSFAVVSHENRAVFPNGLMPVKLRLRVH